MSVYDGRWLVPPAPLRSCVATIRALDRAPPTRAKIVVPLLPSPSSSLVVVTRAGGDMTVLVVGPSTRATFERVVPAPFFVQLRFQPGMARDVFQAPLHELADRVVPVDEIAGRAGMALLETLRPFAGDSRRTVSALEAFLHRRLDRTKPSPSMALLRHAVHALEQGEAPSTGIINLAERLGASERTLRAAFREHVGISPKRYARIVRMRRLLDSARANRWAHLAVDHGFYDQSHLNAEFRALLRVTPSEFLARRFPIAADR